MTRTDKQHDFAARIMISDNVRTKVLDLLARAPVLAETSEMGLTRDNQHLSQCRGWIAEALNITELAVPTPSNAYRRQIEKIGESSGRYPQRLNGRNTARIASGMQLAALKKAGCKTPVLFEDDALR
jgi:hypothetical protein